jgi:hypothetical protein
MDMALFYIEKKTNEAGEYLIHSSACSSLPAEESMIYMGAYAQAPVKEATDRYKYVSTCPNCIPA